jgi:hypothetical protein
MTSMSEGLYQLSLWRLQTIKRRELRKLVRYKLGLEKREAAGEQIPMVGSRDGIDAVIVQETLLADRYDSEIRSLMTAHLIDQAQWYFVPVPDLTSAEHWATDYRHNAYLTPAGILKIRADIRAEKKARWDFWQSRVTFALAIVGAIFGVLAFFKR